MVVVSTGMDLYEYQGKQFLASFGVPVPAGEVASIAADVVAAAERLGFPVAVKAQVRVGGRGKAGGIRLAGDAVEAAPVLASSGRRRGCRVARARVAQWIERHRPKVGVGGSNPSAGTAPGPPGRLAPVAARGRPLVRCRRAGGPFRRHPS